MISLDVRHPDIMEFIDCKTDLERVKYANISVRVSDEFMTAVKRDESFILKWPCDTKILPNDDKRPLPFNELVKEGEAYFKKVRAKDVFDKLVKNNWDYAEPGILYWDRISEYNLLDKDITFSYAGTNPCAK